jgi:hypothetical protein
MVKWAEFQALSLLTEQTRGRFFWGRSSLEPPPQHHTSIHGTMLYLIGLGLSDEADITVKGLEVVRKASRVYLEAYTSILLVDKSILVRQRLFHNMRLGADADTQ